MFLLTESYGDLFSTLPNTSLGHCVSMDFHMSRGIAQIFKHKFGKVQFLKSQIQKVGQCAVLHEGNRYIFYLVTKSHYFMKPSYHTLEQALRSMRTHMELYDVRDLSIPALGSGLDKLEWVQVKHIIHKVFSHTNIHIHAYHLQ